MKAFRVSGPGVVIFIEANELPEEQEEDELEPLPLYATQTGWPEWISGLHTDGTPAWYKLYFDADPASKVVAHYQREYDVRPPYPPPTKMNPDGVNLWIPKENQQQETCQFEPTTYP